MYYITPRNSKTGKKLEEILKRADECFEAQKAVSKKYGFGQWRPSRWAVYGGLSTAVFKSEPDLKIWKAVNANGEYSPRENTKLGKEIKKEFDALPTVETHELNMCIGWDESFSHFGLNKNDTHFGISVNEEWEINMPKDCKEVTATEYKKIFPKKKSKK